jgi:hypothetical protein
MTSPARLLELVERLSGTTVLLVGDLVLDRFVLGTPKRISREAPVIILRREAQRDVPGGAANALANLAALDVRTLSVGVVGDDEPGGALLDALVERGVDTSAVVRRRLSDADQGPHPRRRAGLAEAPGGTLRHRGPTAARRPWLGQLLDESTACCRRYRRSRCRTTVTARSPTKPCSGWLRGPPAALDLRRLAVRISSSRGWTA